MKKISSIIKYYLILLASTLLLLLGQFKFIIKLSYQQIFYKARLVKKYLIYSEDNELNLKNRINQFLIHRKTKYKFSYNKFKENFQSRLESIFKNEKNILFKKYRNPKVSIIIPTYKDFNYTFKCLKSISNSRSKTSYEIILIDDSPPG